MFIKVPVFPPAGGGIQFESRQTIASVRSGKSIASSAAFENGKIRDATKLKEKGKRGRFTIRWASLAETQISLQRVDRAMILEHTHIHTHIYVEIKYK